MNFDLAAHKVDVLIAFASLAALLWTGALIVAGYDKDNRATNPQWVEVIFGMNLLLIAFFGSLLVLCLSPQYLRAITLMFAFFYGALYSIIGSLHAIGAPVRGSYGLFVRDAGVTRYVASGAFEIAAMIAVAIHPTFNTYVVVYLILIFVGYQRLLVRLV